MADLRLVLDFSVSGLAVSATLLGRSFTRVWRGHRCALEFPKDAQHFGVQREKTYIDDPLMYVAVRSSEDEPIVVSVTVLRLTVDIPNAPFGASDFGGGGTAELFQIAHNDVLVPAAEIARSLLATYLTHVRTVGRQPWLGPESSHPQGLGPSHLIDMESGSRLPTGYSEPLRGRLVTGGLTESEHEVFFGKDEQAAAPLPESFLADAIYLRSTDPPQHQHAILLSAIACELKVKEVLIGAAPDHMAEVVQLLFEHPADFSMPVRGLFDRAMKAVTGRSLREEDRPLYKAVDRLFQARNRVAHRGGEGVREDELRSSVTTAQKVVAWLDGVSPAPPRG